MLTARRPSRRASRGVTIVEILVGIAIGLVLVGGVLSLFVTNVVNSRALLIEARVMQDMRAAADLVVRDIRRTAYWQSAIDGTIVVGGAPNPPRNPYQAIVTDDPNTATAIGYTFSRDVTENNVTDNNERFGARVVDSGNGVNVVQLRTQSADIALASGTWQTITDPMVMNVLEFSITPVQQTTNVGNACVATCTTYPGCPQMILRHFFIRMRVQAIADPAVIRRLESRVRMRNDELIGVCPAA